MGNPPPNPAAHNPPAATPPLPPGASPITSPQAPQPVSGFAQPWAGAPAPGSPQTGPQQAMPVQAQYGNQPMPGQQTQGQPMPGQQTQGQPMPGQQTQGQPMPGQQTQGQPMPDQPMPGQQAQGQRAATQWALPAPPEAHPNGHVPSVVAGPATPAKAAGWWRRNRIGLIALLPMLVAVVAVRWDDVYWYMWRSQPRMPVNVAQQEWVAFSGAEMRLAEFGQAKDVVGSNNKPIALPPRVTVWQAVLEFKAPDQDAIGGCEIELEDSEKRLYGRGATELSNVRGQSFISCTRPSEETSSQYRTTVLFITPDNVKPVAVQIRWITKLPSYVRLTVGAG